MPKVLALLGVVYLGKVGGALFVGVMIKGAHVLGGPQEMRPFEILREKMEFRDLGVEGWFAIFFSTVLGNWLVGMAAFLATAAGTVSGKILGVLFPIIAFVAIGLQHSLANMGYFPVGLINGGSGIGWGEALFWIILRASLGNIVGGGGLVALLFWYTYGRRSDQRQGLKLMGQAIQLWRAKSGKPDIS